MAEARLDKDLPIITTHHAAAYLGRKGFRQPYGLSTWDAITVTKGGARLRITSMPGRHGPGLIAFALLPVDGQFTGVPDPSG